MKTPFLNQHSNRPTIIQQKWNVNFSMMPIVCNTQVFASHGSNHYIAMDEGALISEATLDTDHSH